MAGRSSSRTVGRRELPAPPGARGLVLLHGARGDVGFGILVVDPDLNVRGLRRVDHGMQPAEVVLIVGHLGAEDHLLFVRGR